MRALMIGMFGVMLGTACGYADPIAQDRYGGLLALTGDESQAMDEARRLMTAHCGEGNYQVESVEEVVVDEEDYTRTESERDGSVTHDENGREGGTTVTETRSGTDVVTEIHVSYRCLVPVSPPF